MEKKYSKDECLTMLRNSADWRYYRASLVVSCGLFGLGLLLVLLFLLTGTSWQEDPLLWAAMAVTTVPAMIGALHDWYRLRDLLGRWDQYVYAHATVGREEATLDWRYSATALEVMSRGGMAQSLAMPTRNIFHQRYVLAVLDWPLVSEYANCHVIAAFDQKANRAIILQRDYRK